MIAKCIVSHVGSGRLGNNVIIVFVNFRSTRALGIKGYYAGVTHK